MGNNWQDNHDHPKRHPDRNPTRHEVHASIHAADEDRVISDFTDPADAVERAQPIGLEPDDVEKLLPEVLDELDHAGLDAELPNDHPGGTVEEQVKGLPARWGKAGP